MFKNKQEFYRWLWKQLWLRQAVGNKPEQGHTFLYMPAGPVLGRNLDPQPEMARAVESFRKEMVTVFGLEGQARAVVPNPDEDKEDLILRVVESTATCGAIHEGYLCNSLTEGDAAFRNLKRKLEDLGVKVFASPGHVSDAWNTKPYFREAVQSIHGREAVPHGIRFERRDITEISEAVPQMLGEAGSGRVVVKMSGAGGYGNCIISRGEDVLAKLQEFFAQPFDPDATWVSVEEWVAWEATGCTSFFISDERDQPQQVGLVQQVLSPATAGFIGSRSYMDVGEEDQRLLKHYALPIILRMQAEGIRGFCGVDWILSAEKSKEGLYLPGSGLRVRFIEATPRVGGHNQELIALARIAERDGATVDDFIHLRVGTKPIDGCKNRSQVKQWFKRKLKGYAVPLTAAPVSEDGVHFLVECNFGPDLRTIYDSIYLVARKTDKGIAAIRRAHAKLEKLGCLRSE